MDGAKAAGIRLPKPGEYPAIAVFLAVVGVGLGLRVWTAITRPAHGDELGQIEVASRSLGGLLDGVASHLSPPLSYLITAGFAHGLDTSDLFIMRVPSVAAGSLAIVAQFFLARALGYSDRVAIVSALLVALSAYLIGQSTWARMYGEYLLVSQLLLLSYIQFGSTGRRSWLAAWLVSAIALVYLHYFSWILLGALVVHAATQAARGVGRETGRDGWALLRHSVLVDQQL